MFPLCTRTGHLIFILTFSFFSTSSIDPMRSLQASASVKSFCSFPKKPIGQRFQPSFRPTFLADWMLRKEKRLPTATNKYPFEGNFLLFRQMNMYHRQVFLQVFLGYITDYLTRGKSRLSLFCSPLVRNKKWEADWSKMHYCKLQEADFFRNISSKIGWYYLDIGK